MAGISTRNLKPLPDVDGLMSLLKSLAMLDAILSPEWEYRYYSFDAGWDRDEQMGSMRDGSGDSFFALFNEAGCFLKGFAHESPMSPYRTSPPELWPGILADVPDEFASCLSETAFMMDDTTFCIWRWKSDPLWFHGPMEFPDGDDPDGSSELLSLLDGNPAEFIQWASYYYEKEKIPALAVQHVYESKPLNEDVVRSLNNDVSLQNLRDDMSRIGYPLSNEAV